MSEKESQQFAIESAGAAAMIAVLAQVLSENDPEFCEKLERACERGYRVLGEEGSQYHDKRKAAVALRVLGEYLRQIKESKLSGEWETY